MHVCVCVLLYDVYSGFDGRHHTTQRALACCKIETNDSRRLQSKISNRSLREKMSRYPGLANRFFLTKFSQFFILWWMVSIKRQFKIFGSQGQTLYNISKNNYTFWAEFRNFSRQISIWERFHTIWAMLIGAHVCTYSVHSEHTEIACESAWANICLWNARSLSICVYLWYMNCATNNAHMKRYKSHSHKRTDANRTIVHRAHTHIHIN